MHGQKGLKMEEDRRRVPRFPFSASAELIDESSKAKLNVRVTELSLYGCYVDTANPLPRGSIVSLKIFTESEYFEGRANVVYANPNLGMGLAFRDVKPQFLPVLRGWLAAAIQEKKA
jgi:hypothetical protein